jgi:hypothetical protein
VVSCTLHLALSTQIFKLESDIGKTLASMTMVGFAHPSLIPVLLTKDPRFPQRKLDGTVNFTFNRADYGHERCQAVIPWIPIFRVITIISHAVWLYHRVVPRKYSPTAQLSCLDI